MRVAGGEGRPGGVRRADADRDREPERDRQARRCQFRHGAILHQIRERRVAARTLHRDHCRPCAEQPDAESTAGQVACAAREFAVWDDILNETYRRLRAALDARQKVKLRGMQRAWIESRERSCAFYWDFFRGTMASPMNAFCRNRETARRAIFLLGFLDNAEGR